MSTARPEPPVGRPNVEAIQSRDEIFTDSTLAAELDELVDQFLRGELDDDRLTD